jgi:hypothetical protein
MRIESAGQIAEECVRGELGSSARVGQVSFSTLSIYGPIFRDRCTKVWMKKGNI